MSHHVVLGTSIVLALLVGCGSATDSTFNEPGAGDKDLTSGAGFAPSTGSPGSNGTGSSGGAGNVGSVSATDACATASAGVSTTPISLVFMIDRSGSMGNSRRAGQNLATRWNPLVAGLSAFFADPANSDVRASVTFFSAADQSCDVADYTTPAIAMHPLPDAANAFAGVSPGDETPTLPAEQGAIAYAQQVKAGLPAGEKIAIILATDGQPNGCGSTVTNVADEASKVKTSIPTYVIGVGPSTGNLNDIAAGGGTGTAIMVPTGDPAATSAALRAALGQIKASQLGCSYALPAPPTGQSLDVNAVNVNFTPGGGTSTTLAYSADCANAGGWHYDNPAKPSQIVMCPTSCSTLQSDTTGGKIDIVFGCSIAAPPGTNLPGGGVK